MLPRRRAFELVLGLRTRHKQSKRSAMLHVVNIGEQEVIASLKSILLVFRMQTLNCLFLDPFLFQETG